MVTHLNRRDVLKGIASAGVVATSPLLMGAYHDPKAFPTQYGRIVYHKERDPDKHLYIVGQVHRGIKPSQLGNHLSQRHREILTNIYRARPKIQQEMYEIGKHLIQENDVSLLLREGIPLVATKNPDLVDKFFLEPLRTRIAEAIGLDAVVGLHSDNTPLIKRVLQEKNEADAHMLLSMAYGTPLRGADDIEAVDEQLSLLAQREQVAKNDPDKAEFLLQNTRWLGEYRSAYSLLAAPVVLENERKRGVIDKRKAYLSLGLTHLDEMIEFVDSGTISIPKRGRFDPFNQELDLARKDYGVTFIVPASVQKEWYQFIDEKNHLRCLPEEGIPKTKTTIMCVQEREA